jgi:phosphatidylethanolamine/phosphatidyl-N-methylethanolamine N-methyltransferase
MVKVAIDRLAALGLGDHTDLREGTDESMPWANDHFNAVIAIHCFQFWSDPDRSIAEISRVLKPNGRIVLVFRDHSGRAPDWLPNLMSRSGREVELAIELLEKHGYLPVEQVRAG